MHDKFIVLSRLAGAARQPVAVLCGSTNFTENGVYRQGNVVHIAQDPTLAGRYLTMFEKLKETSDQPAQTKKWITANDAIDTAAPIFIGFSPRSGGADLAEFVRIIGGAQRDLLFCTVFALPQAILDALLGKPNDPILRYGLQNSASSITGFHADRTASFAATALLKDGLEGWLKESLAGQKGNILIHTKIVVTDFTSDSPTVLSGSHNLSKPASEGNDENFLIFRGERDIADDYGVEVLRFYDHYRFRWAASQKGKDGAATPDLRFLADDSSWTDQYFVAGSLPESDRRRFAGR